MQVEQMEKDKADSWKAALKRAAIARAARVEFSRSVDTEENSISYRLQSYNSSGLTVGDDRDYDLLKAVMGPLEKLAEFIDFECFEVSLDLKTDVLELRRS